MFPGHVQKTSLGARVRGGKGEEGEEVKRVRSEEGEEGKVSGEKDEEGEGRRVRHVEGEGRGVRGEKVPLPLTSCSCLTTSRKPSPAARNNGQSSPSF